MKRAALFLLAVAAGAGGAAYFVATELSSRHAAELASRQAAWDEERSRFEVALQEAMATRSNAAVSPLPAPSPILAGPAAHVSPRELIAQLRNLKPGAGPASSREARLAVHHLEELITLGASSVSAIREYLDLNEDIDFLPPTALGRRGVPEDFVVPPSLRFGLFDVLKQIAGPEAEQLLGDTLIRTGRGIELAWLARTLQQRAPDKYREAALAAARELLARPSPVNPASPLDLHHRDHLFSVLALYGDTSYVNAAQLELVHPDGSLDRSALKYLHETLGPQAVTIAAHAYQNPLLLTNAAAKEPLARLALSYVGVDPQANEFYQQAINDQVLTKSHRKNLIEDLNQDGVDAKNLGPRDLPLVQNRISLIEQLAPTATDPVNVAAFKEAYKDLINMQERILRQSSPAP